MIQPWLFSEISLGGLGVGLTCRPLGLLRRAEAFESLADQTQPGVMPAATWLQLPLRLSRGRTCARCPGTREVVLVLGLVAKGATASPLLGADVKPLGSVSKAPLCSLPLDALSQLLRLGTHPKPD